MRPDSSVLLAPTHFLCTLVVAVLSSTRFIPIRACYLVQMSAMPTPSDSPVVTRPSTPGFDMSSEDDHIIEIDVESVLFDVSFSQSESVPMRVVLIPDFSHRTDGRNFDQLVPGRRRRLEVVCRDLTLGPRGHFGL